MSQAFTDAQHKAEAIRLGILAADYGTTDVCIIMARLTSPNAEQRQIGKTQVRELYKVGKERLQQAAIALAAADQANRGEPPD